jgi:hypothetical protein
MSMLLLSHIQQRRLTSTVVSETLPIASISIKPTCRQRVPSLSTPELLPPKFLILVQLNHHTSDVSMDIDANSLLSQGHSSSGIVSLGV